MKFKSKFLNRQMTALFVIAMLFGLLSCNFFSSISDSDDDESIEITSLTLGKSTLSMSVGSLDYISVTVKPTDVQKKVSLKWTYDSSIISCDTSSNWGVTVTGVAEGTTSLKCSYGGYDATCIVTVSGYEEGYETTPEPYIYSNTSILQTSPGVTEKVYVSLYGGDASDIDGYTWTLDNSTVASIEPTGQYCVITAKDSGYARIKVTHTKAAYPYYIGVYVFDDATSVTYITTSNNILTMNKDDDEQTISVSLVNGKDTSLDSSFVWEITNQDSDTTPVGLEYNGNNAVITPLESGSCTLRVTHPDATYPLDILCRVITVVKNVYIQPDNTIVYLSGDTEQTVTSSLENIDESEYSIDDYEYLLNDYNVAEIVSYVGNQVYLKGKANGSTKLVISHPKAAYSREVLLIVTGQLTDAVDASCYITTSQNYIRTKVGADPTSLLVSLKGGEDGDENNFTWTVKSTADDGTSDVINLETTNGTAVHSRAAAQTYAYGTAYITPKAVGTAVITVTNPKVYYPTEILVKVLSEDAILEDPLYFAGSGLVKILNGESSDYTVNLKGTNKSSSDDNNISWNISDSRLTIVPSANTVNIAAPSLGTGCTTSTLTASHSKAEQDKTVIVMTADDEETLEAMKALYADKNYYNLEIGDTASVYLSTAGFDTEDDEGNKTEYDFSLMNWTTTDSSVINVEKNTSNPLVCTITALKSGNVTLTASITDSDSGTTYSYSFKVIVYPDGALQTEAEVYFTTSQNVVNLSSAGKTASVTVTPVNLSSSEYSNITWECEDESIATVQPNGNKATITAVTEGETVVYVTHSDSQNTLKIYVRVGSEYVAQESEPVVYISSSDVITMLSDDSATKLQAVLVNYTGSDTSGFSFEIDNESVATIYAQNTNGIAYIKPVASGQAQITISHTATDITKQVLVIVGNSAEELAGYTYLTTSSNVVAIGEGNTKTVSVSVKNSDEVIVDGYTWTSSNQSIVDVTASGATAVLTGNSIGTAIITVTNTACTYSLQIIAQCVDPIAASASPYIQLTSSVMTLTVSSSYTSITADLVGGDESDYSDFVWNTNDSSVAVVYGQNEVGKVRAMSAGTTYITVSHPKAAYSAQILVVCDEATTSDCYISVPSSIISMKPTDSSQTITATLINGSTTDKYNFTYSLDVYDIVDFQYSANVCTITPKTTGSVTITISHPKAAYDQQVIVNVQQYTSFAFPQDSLTITQGNVKFLTMEVPTTTVTTHVEYSVENSAICTVTGTKSTAQITAVGSGTTTVTAKLVATSTGVTQATAEMLVYVKEADTTTCYITATSTIYTVNKGKSQTLSATLTGTGVTTSDQYNLKWTTSDSDVVSVTGIGSDGYVTGQSIYITAVSPGEAIITCSHEKAASTLQFYVVVPGTAEKVVSLNKTYLTLLKGSSGSTIKATIENAESSADYYDIEWSVSNVGTTEVCRVMGSGQTVTIYPLAVGEATVMAQLPDSETVAKCTVIVQANKSFTFATSSVAVQPSHEKTINYTVSPADAVLTWTMSQNTSSTEDIFTFIDNKADSDGNGSVTIIGNSKGVTGSGTIACVTDGGAKGSLTVRVAWDYSFSVTGSTSFTITPDETKTLEYKVNPTDADIRLDSTDAIENGGSVFSYEISDNGDGTGSVTIKPAKEINGSVSIGLVATNPNNDDEEIGTKTITAGFQYSSLTVNILQSSATGNFSRYENGSLYLGDGETSNLSVAIAESKSNAVITGMTYSGTTALGGTGQPALVGGTEKSKVYSVANAQEDVVKHEYLINKAYLPYVNGVLLSDWETAFNWWAADCKHSASHDCFTFAQIYSTNNPGFNYSGYRCGISQTSSIKSWITSKWAYRAWGRYATSCDTSIDTAAPNYKYNSNFTLVEDETLAGKIYSEDDFRKIGWFYCPGTRTGYGSGTYTLYNRGFLCSMDNAEGTTRFSDDEGWYMRIYPSVLTDVVDATYRTSTDSSVVSVSQIGTLIVSYTHNSGTEQVQIPVYAEIRNCAMDYSE